MRTQRCTFPYVSCDRSGRSALVIAKEFTADITQRGTLQSLIVPVVKEPDIDARLTVCRREVNGDVQDAMDRSIFVLLGK